MDAALIENLDNFFNTFSCPEFHLRGYLSGVKLVTSKRRGEQSLAHINRVPTKHPLHCELVRMLRFHAHGILEERENPWHIQVAVSVIKQSSTGKT